MPLFSRLVYFYDVAYRIYMRIYGWFASETEATTVFGARFHCVRADFIQRRIAFFGLFEPNLTYFLAAALKPGDVFIDVGANIGYFTLLAAGKVGPAGKVHAIEASPGTYELLMANLRRNGVGNVTAVNMAVADKECHVEIKAIDKRNIGANAVRVTATPDAHSVVGRPLPAIVGADLDRARFIKIDVEGSEHLVLPAILDHFAARDNDTIIISEISDSNAHLIDFARAKGFTVRALRNNYSINQLLIRAFLRLTDEGDFFVIRDTDRYVSNQHDYVFSRPRPSSPAA